MRRAMLVMIATMRLASAAPLAGQGAHALAAGPSERDPGAFVNRALLGAALKPAYAVRLVSDWPQLTAGGTGCVNGGQEVLSGELVQRSGGNYTGDLTRQATIRFCGVHADAVEACALTLTSRGTVEARGEVRPEQTGWVEPLLTLRWVAATDGGGVAIEGDCSPAFTEALRAMYLGATHALEFPLPLAGEPGRTLRLEDYGWIVDIR